MYSLWHVENQKDVKLKLGSTHPVVMPNLFLATWATSNLYHER